MTVHRLCRHHLGHKSCGRHQVALWDRRASRCAIGRHERIESADTGAGCSHANEKETIARVSMGHAYLPDKPLKHDRPPIVPDTPTPSKRGSEPDDLAAAEHRCASPEPLPVFSRGGGVHQRPDSDEEHRHAAPADTTKTLPSTNGAGHADRHSQQEELQQERNLYEIPEEARPRAWRAYRP